MPLHPVISVISVIRSLVWRIRTGWHWDHAPEVVRDLRDLDSQAQEPDAHTLLARVDVPYIRLALARGKDADYQLITVHCRMRGLDPDVVLAALDHLDSQSREE